MADRIATTTTPMDFVYATAVFTPPAAPTASNPFHSATDLASRSQVSRWMESSAVAEYTQFMQMSLFMGPIVNSDHPSLLTINQSNNNKTAHK